jgi:hypothetical protein
VIEKVASKCLAAAAAEEFRKQHRIAGCED